MLITVEGERDGETLKLRAQAIAVARRGRQGRAAGPQGRARPARHPGGKAGLAELKALLKPGGKGTVCLSLPLDDRGREVEIAMPGRFDISPAQKGAIATVPGVLEVVDI